MHSQYNLDLKLLPELPLQQSGLYRYFGVILTEVNYLLPHRHLPCPTQPQGTISAAAGLVHLAWLPRHWLPSPIRLTVGCHTLAGLTTHPTGAASEAPGHRMLEANNCRRKDISSFWSEANWPRTRLCLLQPFRAWPTAPRDL